MRCEQGAIARNLRVIDDHLRAATRHGAEVVAFPELSLSGYADPGCYPHSVLKRDSAEMARLLALTRPWPVMALVGFIEYNPAGKPYITHLAVRQGQIVGYYRKITIEGDEAGLFSPGDRVVTVDDNGHRFGIAICADIDNPRVFSDSAVKGASLIFEVAAPGLYGEQATRNWETGYRWWEAECQTKLGEYARRHGIWIVVATQAGRTTEEDFPGGCYVFSPDGERKYATPNGSPGAIYLDLDLASGAVTVLAEENAAE